jgi:hypothetical protein
VERRTEGIERLVAALGEHPGTTPEALAAATLAGTEADDDVCVLMFRLAHR